MDERNHASSFALALFVVTLAACPRREPPTETECASLYAHFLELKLSETPRFAQMTDAERAAAKEKMAQSIASDPDVVQVTKQCKDEVTRGEFTCAIAAQTSREWNECIY